MAVRRECDADERGVLIERLRHGAAGAVDDLDPLLSPTAEESDELIAVRRRDERERQVADRLRGLDRIEQRAGREPALLRGDRQRQEQQSG